jgi:hypothetical protein
MSEYLWVSVWNGNAENWDIWYIWQPGFVPIGGSCTVVWETLW